jgi:hypothetical protein
MVDGDLIAACEAEAVVAAIRRGDEVGVAVLVTVVDVGWAAVFEVFARALNAIVVTALLGGDEFRGWRHPRLSVGRLLRRTLVILGICGGGSGEEREQKGSER